MGLFLARPDFPPSIFWGLPSIPVGVAPGMELADVCWWWLGGPMGGASAGILTFSLQAPRDVPATAEATPRGVFGPLKFQPEVLDEDEDDEEDSEAEPDHEELENPRKRAVDRQHHRELSHGSPAKRQRLSNGYENGADSATTPMDIDHHHPDNNHAYPSPLEGEQAESPLLRTEGPSRGTQVEKVRDLTQGTVFLRLGADESAAEAGENPIVLLCEWNPRDPAILATAGTDALARIWTLPCGSAPDSEASHVESASRSFLSIVEEDLPRNATVSALAWSSSGDLIALGTELGNKSRVSIWSVDGTSMHRFDGLDSPVTNLCWSPNNSFLLAISPDVSKGLGNVGTLIHISSPSMVNSMSYVLDHDLRTDNLDATWISETEFLLCGGDLLASFRCTEQGIVQGKEFHTAKDERFTLVEFDWRSRLVATASDKGYIDVSFPQVKYPFQDARGLLTCLACRFGTSLASDARSRLMTAVLPASSGNLCNRNLPTTRDC